MIRWRSLEKDNLIYYMDVTLDIKELKYFNAFMVIFNDDEPNFVKSVDELLCVYEYGNVDGNYD